MIERAVYAYAEAGDALRTIRDNRLYKKDFSSFEDYCRKRWGWSRTNADRQIAAAEIHHALYDHAKVAPTGATLEPPRSERAARELAPLRDDPERLSEVWTKVVEKHGPEAEAKHVRAMVREIEEPAPTPPTSTITYDDGEVVYRRDNGRDPVLERCYDLILQHPGSQLVDETGRVFVSPDGNGVVCVGKIDHETCDTPSRVPTDELTARQRQRAEKAKERLWKLVSRGRIATGPDDPRERVLSVVNIDDALTVTSTDEIAEMVEELTAALGEAQALDRELRARLRDRRAA
ncbi:MAG TPA: hypothetical protein VHF88_07720 [Thermoleophilaceae bacterium]|nr:hypothetical protein [Thermoleophilaceae bacterium]